MKTVYRDKNLYYHTPVHYLPGLDGWRLDALRRMDIVLVVGREDPFLDNNRHLSRILWIIAGYENSMQIIQNKRTVTYFRGEHCLLTSGGSMWLRSDLATSTGLTAITPR